MTGMLGNGERIIKKGGRDYIYIYKYGKKEEGIYLDQKIIFIYIFNHQFIIRSSLLLPN